MKHLLIGLCVLGLLLAGAAPVLAGGTINKSNLSPEYMGSYTRNASTDHADIVAYNPAGTVKLEDGLTVNLGLQYLVTKDYSNNFTGTNDAFTGTDYNSDEPSLIPGFYTVYKKGPWAGFFGVNVPVGGGKVDYGDGNFVTYSVAQGIRAQANGGVYQSAATLAASPNPVEAAQGAALLGFLTPNYGSPLTAATNPGPYSVQSHQIEAESFGVGYTIGGAYQINDMVSVSAGLRFIDAKTEMEGSASLALDPTAAAVLPATVPRNIDRSIAFEADATGWGGIFGLDFFPSERMTVGLRYETRTELEYKYDVSKGADILADPSVDITDGAKKRDDLPATLGAGIGYRFTDKLRCEANLTWYFNTRADIGGSTLREGLENEVDDGWELGIGATYAFTEKIQASAGYLYTSIGVDPKNSSKFLPDLNSHALGLGLRWTVIEDLDLTFAAGNVFYVSDDYVDDSLSTPTANRPAIEAAPTKVEYEKNIPYLGFGIQYKFF